MSPYSCIRARVFAYVTRAHMYISVPYASARVRMTSSTVIGERCNLLDPLFHHRRPPAVSSRDARPFPIYFFTSALAITTWVITTFLSSCLPSFLPSSLPSSRERESRILMCYCIREDRMHFDVCHLSLQRPSSVTRSQNVKWTFKRRRELRGRNFAKRS